MDGVGLWADAKLNQDDATETALEIYTYSAKFAE